MSNISTAGMTRNGQFVMTLPKAIARAMEIKKGDKIEFLFKAGHVVLKKQTRGD